ncbi:adenosine receptor A2b-like [Diadema antillarum]|uniref:adenosine receptor A2b-like n=2 Tax=Diadema antillarum TaxID=105358 RepID=UPI003A88E09A
MFYNDSLQQAKYPLDNSPFHQSLLIVFFAPVMLAAIGGNVLTIAAVWKESGLRTPNYHFLTSLALSDLLTGLVATPLELYSRIIQNPTTCSFVKSGYFSVWSYVFGSVSIFHLILVTIERHLAITRPLKYISLVTSVRVRIIIVIIWCLSLSYGIVTVIDSLTIEDDLVTQLCSGLRYTNPSTKKFYMATGVSIMMLGVLMIAFNIRILRIAVGQSRRVKRRQIIVAANNQQPDWKANANQLKATRTILFLVGMFFLSWFPTCIWYLIRMEVNISHLGQILLINITFFFTNLSSAVNPFIYCVKDSVFRRAFCKICPPIKRCLIATKIHHNPEDHTLTVMASQANIHRS